LVETPSGHGSGWLLEPGLLITNEHVIRRRSIVTIRQGAEGAGSFSATVVASDKPRDIALLRFNTSTALQAGAAPLEFGVVTQADLAGPLMALGYSSTNERTDGSVGAPTANVGVLSQVVDFSSDGFGLNLEMDTPIDPGDSGGPVFNADGQVIGINRAVLVNTATGQRVVGTFYAVHIDEIIAALPRLRNGLSR
jgi:serine protease Do